MNRPEDSFY